MMTPPPLIKNEQIMDIEFIQIGFNKTGTTFLENNVYRKHPDIECCQIVYNVELERLFNHNFIEPLKYNYDKNNFLKEFNQLFTNICKNNDERKKYGFMYESLTFQYSKRINITQIIERLSDTFPDAKIILFIRSQTTWLMSHYSQYLQNGGKLTLHDFFECIFCHSVYDGMAIDWYPLVKTIYDYYPQENVFIGIFEELEINPQDTANKLFDLLNIPKISINPQKVNPSLNYWGLKTMRFLNRFVYYDCGTSLYSFFRDLECAEPTYYKKIYHSFIYRLYKPSALKIARYISNTFKSDKKILINEKHQKKIFEEYHENNLKLSNLIHVDLKSYNYP